MTSKKKLVKLALNDSNLYSPAELAYFRLWLKEKAWQKDMKRLRKKKQEMKPEL
jgi:hypothetical protein